MRFLGRKAELLKNKIELMNVHKMIKTIRNKIKRNAGR